MSLTAAMTLKPVIMLTLRGAAWPLAGLARLLSEAAEARGSALATTYLTAMGLGDSAPPLDRRPRSNDW